MAADGTVMRRLWAIALGISITATALAGFVLGVSGLAIVRALVGFTYLVAIGYRLRTDKTIAKGPWLWLLAGGTLALVSAVVRIAHGAAIDAEAPFPSWAEIPGLVGYACFPMAARSFWHHRSSRNDMDSALDGFLVGAASAIIVFTALLSDYIRDSSIDIWARSGNVAYTVLDLITVTMVARLAVGPGVRNQAWRLLAMATVLILFNDLLFLMETTGSLWAEDLALVTSPLAFAMALSSILHPDVAELTNAPSYSPPRLTMARLALLATALLTLPAALLFALVRNTEPDLPVLVVGSAVLAFVSLTRIALLFRASERAASLEVSVADSGRSIVEAGNSLEVADGVAATVQLVLGEGAKFAARIEGIDGRTYLVRHTSAGQAETLLLGADDHEPNLHWEINTVDRADTIRLQLGGSGEFGEVLIGDASVLDPTRRLALRGMAAQITQAMASLSLSEARFSQRAEQRLQALVEQSSDLVTVLDGDSTMQFVSPNATRVLGKTPQQLVGTSPRGLVHPDELDAVRSLIASPTLAHEPAMVIEARLLTEDEYRWFDITARDFRDDDEVGGIVVTARDVHDERAAKIGLTRSEQWFRGLVQNSSDVIAVLDEDGVFTYASPAATKLTGHSPAALRGRNFLELLPSDDTDSLERVRKALRAKPPGVRNLELTIQRPDLMRRTAEVTITDLRDDPSVSGLVLNVRDVTDRKRLEEDLRHQVLHDDLTGLGSRVQFSNQLQAALAAPRRNGSMVAALFIDVDDFKTINDSLGHAAGDQVLVDISGRLRSKLRLHDNAARFGGDEFAVLLTDVYGESDVTLVADRIVEELSQPVLLMGQEVRLGVSVGIAFDEDGSKTPEDLLRAADVAMYEAKSLGKGRWAMFEDSMADQTIERFEINNSLGTAIENDELMVYYQPIIDLGSGRTIGVEALVRWNHPVRGMISPGQFIPIAERNGMIAPIGHWVLEQAAHQVAEWRGLGHDLYASVNVSAMQLQRDGIVHEILDVVDGAQIDRRAIVLELTESALISDFDLVNRRIDALREAGLRVAIDDFGTGYATLTYADQFAADILKIDQSFVARLEESDDSAIVTTVLNIAAAMGAETVAEGIEVPDQHRRLLALGCSLGQGYYFKRPAPAEAISESLARELDGEALAGHGH
ncbi:MAG: EAL domain-containing protein [Actinomycetota bacterium]